MAHRDIIKTIPIALLFGGLTLSGLFLPQKEYSDTERRPLAKLPSFSADSFLSGDYAEDFETYSLDQFPLRDYFRSLKSYTTLYALGQKQVNDLYVYDGYIVKSTQRMHDSMIANAAERFNSIYRQYMADTDTHVYLSIIPDKNFFLADDAGQLSMDYPALVENLTQATPDMEYIDIFPTLDITDYYYTDTHWKQESLLPTADAMLTAMLKDEYKIRLSAEQYSEYRMDTPFYGVYYGQLGLPISADTLYYLSTPTLEHCIVTNYDTGAPAVADMYDLSKKNSKDPYELFLCGASALVTIDNPNASTDKELIIFRDSFGSSITPLLVDNYAKITLVDIRYMHSGMLGNFITFDDQDVLFLYSTLVLNSSTSFK